MSLVDETIQKLQRESEIDFNSVAYEEIARGLTDLGLNLAFFVFTSSDNSSTARTLKDGSTMSFPVLNLYLKHDDDFHQTGIDPHQGNWDGKWKQTVPIRNLLNTILEKFDFGSNNISDQTFVFVETLERVAFLQIGKQCKNAVKDLVCTEAPGVKVSEIFWTSTGKYHVIMKNKADCKRMKHSVKTKVTNALPQILKNADTNCYCQSYKAPIDFLYEEVNLFNIIRESV